MRQRVTYKIGNEELILETGHLAKQANGAIYAQYGKPSNKLISPLQKTSSGILFS